MGSCVADDKTQHIQMIANVIAFDGLKRWAKDLEVYRRSP
jgi:hypothetical protein